MTFSTHTLRHKHHHEHDYLRGKWKTKPRSNTRYIEYTHNEYTQGNGTLLALSTHRWVHMQLDIEALEADANIYKKRVVFVFTNTQKKSIITCVSTQSNKVPT